MQNLRTLLIQFNKPFWVYLLVFNGFGLYMIVDNGIRALGFSLLLKLVGYAGAVGYQNYFSPQVYFYYRNAGYQVRQLYLYSFLLDLIVYAILITVYQLIILPLC